MLRVVIGSDHGGFALKQELANYIRSKGYELQDVGTHSTESCDYPDVAKSLCEQVVGKSDVRGVLLCGSGIGISIAANKVAGIRCALCHDYYTAIMARKHNDANVVALGGRTTGIEVAKQIVDGFLETSFLASEGRHSARIAKIHDLEEKPSSS